MLLGMIRALLYMMLGFIIGVAKGDVIILWISHLI
jgi:hypothetical protein